MSVPINPIPIQDPLAQLVESNYLFRGFTPSQLAAYLNSSSISVEKFPSSRPIYTAFHAQKLQVLYALVGGGPVIIRSSPLDRVISITYPGSCFGMRNLPFSHGVLNYAFPSQVEAYKTTLVIKIAIEAIHTLYRDSDDFQHRYNILFELREKFQYHLLNCSAYPPQAVASLLQALAYQEQQLGNQPDPDGVYRFDLPVDLIARACQLTPRTVEQVLKGLNQIGVVQIPKNSEGPGDLIQVLDAEHLSDIYSTTRDKVEWWPLK